MLTLVQAIDEISALEAILTGCRQGRLAAENRVAELEAALARVADEPNIDKARAIADAVLSGKP